MVLSRGFYTMTKNPVAYQHQVLIDLWQHAHAFLHHGLFDRWPTCFGIVAGLDVHATIMVVP